MTRCHESFVCWGSAGIRCSSKYESITEIHSRDHLAIVTTSVSVNGHLAGCKSISEVPSKVRVVFWIAVRLGHDRKDY